ncbi:MAG: hypothetical protein Kow0042_07680 [Calditrichia bacterium]
MGHFVDGGIRRYGSQPAGDFQRIKGVVIPGLSSGSGSESFLSVLLSIKNESHLWAFAKASFNQNDWPADKNFAK